MNAKEFFEKYSIEEISKKTKISPISLRYIKNKEFDKLPRVKFFGFINIIEKTFNVDLSDLKEEYNQFIPPKNEIKQEIKFEEKKDNKFILISAIILAIIGIYMLKNSITNSKIDDNNLSSIKILTPKTSSETKQTEKNNSTIVSNNIKNETNNTKTKSTKLTKIKPPSNLSEVDIIPNEKVWFRALNIDNNKTIQYLTSKEKILPKGNYYIKFGHGNLTIIYANQTITPNTKKIVRILLKNGKYKFMQKPNRYEK